MATRTGRHALIEQLLADGLNVMFGNPGTVEQGFLDSLEDYPDFHYILGLQETIPVAMADGYARGRGKAALVQLHSGVGLGNGVGMMYQALRGHAPLVVIAGDSGVKYEALDAQMACDLVAIAQPVTKWATRVTHPANLLRVLRKAVKIATTPPMGPVFVALPADVLDAPATEPVMASTQINTQVSPPRAQLEAAARTLLAAQHPLILMGDGITVSGAQQELVRVAELLGAPVYGVDASEVNMPFSHPLYQGTTGHMFGEVSAQIVAQADAILVVGTYIFPEVFPLLEAPFAPGCKIIHLDLNTYEIAKNFPADQALLGDPKVGLAGLATALDAMAPLDQRKRAAEALKQARAKKETAHQAAVAADHAAQARGGGRMALFAETLASQLPVGSIVFDEALTNSPAITRYLNFDQPGTFFQTRGGSLGVGIPGALGLKLAHPDRTVVGFTGDGGSMYTIQALWTAARHQIDAKFVICNNGAYKLLKLNIDQYWDVNQITPRGYPHSFDLSNPVIDFAAVARGMHVAAERVERNEDVGAAIERMLAHQGPYLIDLILPED